MYHYFAGFSGGAKAVMPGICSHKSIEHSHAMMLSPGARAGILKGNPVREDIDEAGGVVGIDFIFNVVLSGDKRILHAVAGHSVATHRVGVRLYDRRFNRTIERPTDIVVASPGGYPKDLNLYQAQKTLDNVGRAVRDGGAIILATRCQEGFGQSVFEEWMLDMARPEDLIDRIHCRFRLGGHKAAAIAGLLCRVTVYLLSEFPDDVVRRFHMIPIRSLSEGLARAQGALGAAADALVVPCGNRVRAEAVAGAGS